jgi:iron complex outermembrane receptor protein
MARRTPVLAVLLLAAALQAAGQARAADEATASVEAGEADELMNLPLESLLNFEISAASRFAQKASEAPSAVTVVTADDIRAYGYRTFADILRSIRGLYVTYDRNYNYIGVRGFARAGDYNTRVLLLVDGYRVTDNVYDQAPIGTDFPLDVDLIERVEFIPGPGSSVYGSGAFLGVINVITRNAADFERAELKGEVASAGTLAGRATAGKRFDSGAQLLLSASGMERDGRDLYYPEFDSPATNNGIAQGLDYDRAQRFFGKFSSTEWTVAVSHSEREKGIPTASFLQAFNDPRSQTVDRRSFVSVGYTHAWSDHDFSARVSYSDSAYAGAYSYALPPAGVLRDGADGQWWDTELQFGTRAVANHHFIAGVDYHRDMHQDQYSYDEQPRFDYMDDHRSGYRYGLYLQDEVALGPKWLLNAGVRYDDYYTDNESSVNPRVAVIYQPRDSTSLKLLYGTAFRSPNAYERYYVSSGYKINPNLSPEKIRTYEFVVEERRPQGLRLSASAFHYAITDLISLTTDPADGMLVMANVDRAETTGTEFEVERIWEAGTRMRASVTWQRAEDGTTGERLTNSPSILGKANLAVPVLRGWADAGLEMQYVGSRRTLAGQRAGAYTLFNLTLVTRKLASNLEVSASIYNLFDREYGDPGSEEHVQDIIMQDGRSLRISGTWRF